MRKRLESSSRLADGGETPRRGRIAAGGSAAILALLTMVLACLPAAAAAPAAQGTADPAAAELADRVMQALGGRAAWEAAALIRFDFAGRRKHAWDKAHGRSRIEGTTPEGEHWLVIQDLASRTGRAWVDGEEVTGERAAELVENAYRAWVNDTYWLVMPYKLRDPGVHLTSVGRREIDGTPYDVLHLSFDHVGLTPGDQYWAYFDPQSHLMVYFEYLLESMPRDAAPTRWRWQGWEEHAGIRLAPHRAQTDSDHTIDLGPIEVFRKVPESLFAGP